MDSSPPFAFTYISPELLLPNWLSYTSSATETSTAVYSYTSMNNGIPTVIPATIILTKYGTDIVQLPITVDADSEIILPFPYTRAGGTTGPVVVSILGATGVMTIENSFIPTATTGRTNFASTLQLSLPSSTAISTASSSRTTRASSTIPKSFTPRTTSTTSRPTSMSFSSSRSTAFSITPMSSVPSAAPSGTPYYSNHATLKSSLALVLGTVGGIMLVIGGLWLIERRRKRNARGGAGEDWSSVGSSHKAPRKYWFSKFNFLKKSRGGTKIGGGIDELYSPGLTADMQERDPLSGRIGGGIYSKPKPRKFSRNSKREIEQVEENNSIDDTSTLLDNDLNNDDLLRLPTDSLNHSQLNWQGISPNLQRISTSSPNKKQEDKEAEPGDLSSPQQSPKSTRHRIFVSPVISDTGAWFGGFEEGSSTETDHSSRNLGSGSGTGTATGSGFGSGSRTRVLSIEEEPQDILFKAPRWGEAQAKAFQESTTRNSQDFTTTLNSSINDDKLSRPRLYHNSSSAYLPLEDNLQERELESEGVIDRIAQTFSSTMRGLGLNARRSLDDEERRFGKHLSLVFL